jgi:hypothetical protein
MPRKTDGIQFELHPGPKRDEEGKPLLYARPATGISKTIRQLDDFCAEYRNLQKGEMERLFNLFIDVAGSWLAQGYRVETPIGSFAMKLKLTGDHTDAEKVTGRDIVYNGVEFTPSKELIAKAGSNREGFRKKPGYVGNSQMYDPKAMEEALRKSLTLGYTTVSTFMYFSKLKRDSAQHYLDSLSKGENARLLRRKNGRTYVYSLRNNSTPEQK